MERMFNAYKIRYEMLNEQFLPSRASNGVHNVNIFINLDDFYHRIHKPYTELEFQTTGTGVSKQIVANLLNLIAHYKNWAAKEKMGCKIYLIYTTARVFKNAVRISRYREYYNLINSPTNLDFFHINQAIENGFSILQVLTKYVQNIYAIDTSYLEPSMVPYYLSLKYRADFNLFVTRDEYDFQYVAFHNWAIIMPKGDESILVTKGNLWDIVREKNSIEREIYFHPDLFVAAKTILGDKYRTIPKLTRTGWKTVVKYLEKVSSPDASEDTLRLQLDELRKFIDTKKIQDTSYTNNFYCTSVKQQVEAMLESDKAIIDHQLQDLDDQAALEEINRTIFREFPIELYKLFRLAPAEASFETHDDYVWRKLMQAKKKAKGEC